MQDRAVAAFGPGASSLLFAFVQEPRSGADPLGAVLADDALLQELLARLLTGEQAPAPADGGFEWRAHPPGVRADPTRRAVRRRRETAALALLRPRRGRARVAGRRHR
jgi:hypothetical protein